MIFPCYSLIENKMMSDGFEVPKDKTLYCIKSEDDILFLLFEDDKENQIMFWSRIEDVVYIGDYEKELELNVDDIINGNYFNLI
jgi:hypothetical protein